MKKVKLSEEIENLLLLIAKEEENYKTAHANNADFIVLHNMRVHLRTLKEGLHNLLEHANI